MKELDGFTVERLEELSTKENIPELAALARIALAAKRAEPVAYEVTGILCHTKEEADLFVGTPIPLYEAPPLNAPERQDGWIECGDLMPKQKQTNRYISLNLVINNRTVVQGGFDDGIFWLDGREISGVTHWMQLPAAPENPL